MLPSKSSATLRFLCGALFLLLSAPASADCDVIPQPETVFRGAEGSLNRVFASPDDSVVVSLDDGAGG